MEPEAPKTIAIGSTGLSAEIATRGAELVRLRDIDGRDLLWDGDPAFWSSRSPLLFPIVGRLKDDTLTIDGVSHTMKQHGIARTRPFAVTAADVESCTLRLQADDETRAIYPFDFVLDVTYAVHGASLSIEAVVRNTGQTALPASFGLHPAFRWPLPFGGARDEHVLVFEQEEPGPLHRLGGGLLAMQDRPSPIQGRTLVPRDELFVDDALIFLAPRSRSVLYGVPGRPRLRVDYPKMPQLGIWTKPGAGFVCIEPWFGYASPQEFSGDFADKPGLAAIPPGGAQGFGLSVTIEE